MKLTDEDIKSILKLLTPKEFLEKFINTKVSITNKQLTRLIQMKNGERETYDE